MKVATTNIFKKSCRVITSGVRNTSCNHGWLRVFTHIVCGSFTVASFILILLVTFTASGPREAPPSDKSRCELTSCRVICHEAPLYEEYEDDIVLAVMEAEMNCQRVFLTLHEPTFTDESLPRNWLLRLRPVLYEISIIGGNLHRIPQNTFSAGFARNLGLLLLERITIISWTQNALLGLANLDHILIKECNIIDMQENVLSAVSQTLTTLTVIRSGQWNPENLIGSSETPILPNLTTVDMSGNDFGGILGETSFTRLKFCKSLYLSSSKISYIRPGAFDNLINIEYLNLYDNLLRHIDSGLFTVMMSHNTAIVRLNLVNNFWNCNCSNYEMRRLIRQGVLLVEPVCHSPKEARGKTFTEFVTYCKNIEPKKVVDIDMTNKVKSVHENLDSKVESVNCISEIPPNYTSTFVSPLRTHPCSVNVVNYSIFKSPSMIADLHDMEEFIWIKPTVIFKGHNITMIELSLTDTEGFGLIWYRKSCLNQIFCINIVPDTIRLYNIDLDTEYTFCPMVVNTGAVRSSQCVAYMTSMHVHVFKTRMLLFPLIALSCLFFGASSLYLLIRKYPFLLKGSKRLLFVKHKTVDALVLPPKLPLRGVLSEGSLNNCKDVVSTSVSLRPDFKRLGSVRSSYSCAPSYISALQPTEEQLAYWRLKQSNETFENHYATISTISSETPVSISSDSDNLYFSIEDVSPIITCNITGPFSHNLECETINVS